MYRTPRLHSTIQQIIPARDSASSRVHKQQDFPGDRRRLLSFTMNPGYYRFRFFLDLVRVFVVPVLALHYALSFWQYRLGTLSLPVYSSFVIGWATVKCVYVESRKWREALSLGARPIPQVVGKWPGNIDVLFKMMRAFKTSYIQDVYLQLFEEYQCTTLNTRILWRDNVRPFRLVAPHLHPLFEK